jgi:hypothetical protein
LARRIAAELETMLFRVPRRCKMIDAENDGDFPRAGVIALQDSKSFEPMLIRLWLWATSSLADQRIAIAPPAVPVIAAVTTPVVTTGASVNGTSSDDAGISEHGHRKKALLYRVREGDGHGDASFGKYFAMTPFNLSCAPLYDSLMTDGHKLNTAASSAARNRSRCLSLFVIFKS